MSKIRYYVFDPETQDRSDYYVLRLDATMDLIEDVTRKRSPNADIIECSLDVDGTELWRKTL